MPSKRSSASPARLRSVPIFEALPDDLLATLARQLTAHKVAVGSALFEEGDRADSMYLVESGRLQVEHGPDRIPIAVVGPGGFVGELGLLLGEPRTATVRALEDCVVLRLRNRDLQAATESSPKLALALTAEIGKRLVNTSQRLTGVARSRVAAVWGEGAEDLAAALVASAGRGTIVTLPGSPAVSPTGGVEIVELGGAKVASRMDDLVFRSGKGWILVLLPERPTRAATQLVGRADVVTTFGACPEWLAAVGSQRVEVDPSPPGIERAVRWVMGKAVGLVLSAGASRTVAHIGVIKALKAAGVPIDAMAGSSGGALVAAGIASGLEYDRQVEIVRQFAALTRTRRLDFNIPPRTALVKGRRIHRFIDGVMEGRTFEDLDIPLKIVAADLDTGEEVVYSSGSLADAIRASLSIPGVFDPWRRDGRLLIDGGVVNPLPVSVLRSDGVPIIIASNVAGIDPPQRDGPPVSPGMVASFLRVSAFMEKILLARQRALADVVVRPRVLARNAFDFSRIDEFVLAGELAVRQQLRELERVGAKPKRPRRTPRAAGRSRAAAGRARPRASR